MSLRGRSVLITSGPTREPLDPVRFLTNGSTGAMGFALARAALRRGARVTVVCGPVSLRPPRGALLIPVMTALQMRRETLRRLKSSDVLIAAAAVSDWRVARPSRRKLPKAAQGRTLRLLANPDIVAEAARRRKGGSPFIVGFALETHDWLEHARAKLRRKRLDLIVANRTASMGAALTHFAVLDREGGRRLFPAMRKDDAAAAILDCLDDARARCAAN